MPTLATQTTRIDYKPRKIKVKVSKKKPTIKTLSQQVNKIAKTISQDVRHKDEAAAVSPSTTLVTVPFYNVSQGDQPYEREGNRITPSSLSFKYYLTSNSAGAVRQQVRIMIVQVTAYNQGGSLYTMADILQNVTTYLCASPRNDNHMNQFRVLADKSHVLYNDQGSPLQGTDIQEILILGKSMLPIDFYNSSTNSFSSNPVFLLYQSDIASGSNPPAMVYYAREYYHA